MFVFWLRSGGNDIVDGDDGNRLLFWTWKTKNFGHDAANYCAIEAYCVLYSIYHMDNGNSEIIVFGIDEEIGQNVLG